MNKVLQSADNDWCIGLDDSLSFGMKATKVSMSLSEHLAVRDRFQKVLNPPLS